MIEKRNPDGSKIKPGQHHDKAIDWDTDLGGPVIEVPPDTKEPQATTSNADQPVSKHRQNRGTSKASAKTAGTAQGDAASESAKLAESPESESGGDATEH
jgi:hypothetical protein